MLRSRWVLLGYFALVFVALTLALPSGRRVWGESWPSPRLRVELTGGTQRVILVRGADSMPIEKQRALEAKLLEYYGY